MSFRYSDKKIQRLFRNDSVKPKVNYIKYKNYVLRYLELTTNSNLPYVVFIHGAPGSSADYIDYFRDTHLYKKVNLISVDRLGYGNSEFGHAVTSLKEQAQSIEAIINFACKSKRIILVAHSYGGPVAIKMAIDYPTLYSNIVLLAPALDPDNEKKIKIAQLAFVAPTKWLTPPALRVAAGEKKTHIDELKKLVPNYSQIEIPICHIHGTSDSLVPYENLAFSKEHINPTFLETITLEGVDHFLPWTHHDFLVNKILELVQG